MRMRSVRPAAYGMLSRRVKVQQNNMSNVMYLASNLCTAVGKRREKDTSCLFILVKEKERGRTARAP